MALDPSIILHAGDALKALPNYGDVMEQRARVQARQQALAEHNQAVGEAAAQKQAELAKQQRRVSLGRLAAGGDLAGADKAALEAGDFDLHSTIKGLQDEQRAKTRERAQAIGQAALYADTPEKWDAAIDQLVQSGHPDVGEYKGKFSPEAREAAINSARSVEDAFKSYEEQNKPYTLSPGEQRFSGNKMVASVAPQKKFVLDQETGQVVQLGGDGVAPGAPGAPGISGKPVANGRAAIEDIFPGVHVTDNLRDPNSKLGRANPNSWHNKSGGAVDVRPIPGMSFDEYVAGIKQAGYSIIEARDEVTNPSGHATGPHWHVVIGKQGEAPPRRGKPPSGFKWTAGGDLQRIPVIGADGKPEPAKEAGKVSASLRKEFDGLPEVKNFRIMHRQMGQIAALGKKGANATAQDDMALIFSYMKMLDPTSVVREGEYATAQNAVGVPDQLRNTYNRVVSGNRLAPAQRQNMVRSAKTAYEPALEQYNQTAERFQGYSRDNGVAPGTVARRFVYGKASPVMTPEQVRNSPSGTRYRTTDGREGVRP